MVCPNCQNDNNGIKLNGKLFCISCGEVMENATELLEHSYEINKDASQNTKPEPKRFSKEGADITSQKNSYDIELLEAEEEILEEVEKVAENKFDKNRFKDNKNDIEIDKKYKVEKNNRERITILPSKEFNLVPGEPDPIHEKELPSPHDMQLTTNNIDFDKEMRFPLHKQSEQETIQSNIENKQQALTDFFINSTQKISSTKTSSHKFSKRKQNKKVKKKSNKIMIGVIAFIILLSALAGLIYYVNNIAINPDTILSNIEKAPEFEHKRPSYIPAGYEISYESYSHGSEIHYYYKYLPNSNQFLIISISETAVNESTILDELIKPLIENFYKYPLEYSDVWFIGENKALYIENGLLYEISTSSKINVEDTIKIIKGLN